MREKKELQGKNIDEIQALYTKCMNCSNTTEQCPGIWKETKDGIPPRGFYYRAAPVKILAVAKNPGHPHDREIELYAGLGGRELPQVYRNYQSSFYPGPNNHGQPSGAFHRNMFRYLAAFLDVPQSDIYLHAAHTNIVKCSTPEESTELDPQTVEECYQRYFVKEISLFKPKVLLALGREVERFLLGKAWKHCLPIIYVRHPSYPYPKEDEESILRGIKDEIQKHI